MVTSLPEQKQKRSRKGRPLVALHSFLVFFRELISHPLTMGAACPSSPQLTRCMATFAPLQPKGFVVELGAGTGVVTEDLLRKGIPPEKLIVIERSVDLAGHLRKRFPEIRVLCGDAAQLKRLIKEKCGIEPGQVDCVVSSLPLRSLPGDLVQTIICEMEDVLADKGRVVQFTYDLRKRGFDPYRSFTRSRWRIVWLNIPPARVDVFKKRPRLTGVPVGF